MNTWFEYQPVDTVFCKGAEPMEMGEHHSASSIFPPPPETIAGAVRSAVLEQQKISIPDYYQGNVDKEIITAIGRAGQKAPFEIIGPFFLNCKECYVPAPYFWFTEKTQLKNNSKVTIYRARPLSTSLIKSDLPASRLYWAKGKKDILTTLGGHYIKMTDLFAQKEQIEVKKSSNFFIFEQRTGIALSHNRTVREGHLYSFNHGRLKNNVKLVFGITTTLPLTDRGVLKLGGEQRFGYYRILSKPPLQLEQQTNNDHHYMSLSLYPVNQAHADMLIATGKIVYIGGWDMQRGFHKPMRGFWPAGTVFKEKISDNFIAIGGNYEK